MMQLFLPSWNSRLDVIETHLSTDDFPFSWTGAIAMVARMMILNNSNVKVSKI